MPTSQHIKAQELERETLAASKALHDFEAGFPGHKHNPCIKTIRGVNNRNQHKALRDAVSAASGRLVRWGFCPQCGRKLRANLSITGWYQCEQFGAEQFRADASKPACSYQIIITRS